jgi:hypothetical protein
MKKFVGEASVLCICNLFYHIIFWKVSLYREFFCEHWSGRGDIDPPLVKSSRPITHNFALRLRCPGNSLYNIITLSIFGAVIVTPSVTTCALKLNFFVNSLFDSNGTVHTLQYITTYVYQNKGEYSLNFCSELILTNNITQHLKSGIIFKSLGFSVRRRIIFLKIVFRLK